MKSQYISSVFWNQVLILMVLQAYEVGSGLLRKARFNLYISTNLHLEWMKSRSQDWSQVADILTMSVYEEICSVWQFPP